MSLFTPGSSLSFFTLLLQVRKLTVFIPKRASKKKRSGAYFGYLSTFPELLGSLSRYGIFDGPFVKAANYKENCEFLTFRASVVPTILKKKMLQASTQV